MFEDECTNLVKCDCKHGTCLSTRMGCDDPPREGLAEMAKDSCCITVGRNYFTEIKAGLRCNR